MMLAPIVGGAVVRNIAAPLPVIANGREGRGVSFESHRPIFQGDWLPGLLIRSPIQRNSAVTRTVVFSIGHECVMVFEDSTDLFVAICQPQFGRDWIAFHINAITSLEMSRPQVRGANHVNQS